MIDLKSYFHNKYQGGESFVENVILPIFGEDKYEDAYEEDVLENNPELTTMADSIGISSLLRMGTINIPMNPTDVFDITVTNHVQMKRNRVTIQSLVRRIMSTYSSAFMVFHYDDDTRWDWRFTFCSKQSNNQESTDSKRYTFMLGPNQSCRTAAENFKKLAEKHGDIELQDIVKAFSIEALSDMFFAEYKKYYEDIIEFVTGKRMVKDNNKWVEKVTGQPCREIMQEFAQFPDAEKAVRDYVKKLMGRLVFIQFLQKKGWMGCSAGEAWNDGDREFVQNLFANSSYKDTFVDDVLEPLFNDINTKRAGDLVSDTKIGTDIKVPFLNGGLFEKDNYDQTAFPLPAEYMKNLLDFFASYNFTIDENDPDDAEIGVDPEMLGRIFENLLEDNKDKGAFYTPKEIVQYMCRESLIAYLQTDVTDEPTREALRRFVTTHDATVLGGKDSPLALNVNECLQTVKICDPAIGSGAFPMGLLNELFLCRGAIEDFDNAAAIKRHIIQKNIYGVDIEKGAVDIARLRFWLSLIVNEENPHALPNMDFKIMQGNSLLEQYKGFDLSHIMDTNTEILGGHQYTMFDNELDVIRAEVKRTILDYYNEEDHDKRRLMRQTIQEKIQQQISTQSINVDISDINDIASTDQFFLWHTWFSDVFDEGGFDIVIGNPPYIQLQNNAGSLGRLYQNCGYEVFASTGDIYSLFYERGTKLLKQGGHLCYITSNKWMRAGYGEKTRGFFTSKTNPKLLIDFAGVQIFESATVDTNILLLAKEENAHKTQCCTTGKEIKDCLNNLSDYVQQHSSEMDFSGSESWIILSKIEQSIKRKIESVGTPLKDWNINIYRGVLTGCNEAFIISTDKRNEILDNCNTEDERKRTDELIRPILRGRDIKRYGYDWANRWLIATFPSRHYDIEDYPSIKEYLLSFGIERLEQTGKVHTVNGEKIKARKKTNNKWFETQDSISYWEDFYKPKICWASVGESYYSLIPADKMLLDTNYFFAVDNPEYLLGFLNSKLIIYWINSEDTQIGNGGAYRHYKYNLEKLRIPQSIEQRDFLIDLVKQYIISPTNEADYHINNLIYKIYNLSEEEIGFIECVITH